MFTGLIEEIGVISEVQRGRGLRLAIRASKVLEDLKVGDSIAVNGACLTAEKVEGGRFLAALLPETAAATTLGTAKVGTRVNLERPLQLGARLGGHLVAGHVDGLAEVAAVTDRGETRLIELVAPAGLERYLVDRGSVALDGVSLTVRAPQGRRFSVALIRETLGATTLGERKAGDKVNFEADLLAKHIERLLPGSSEKDETYQAWLAEAE